jgi:divalent metal cation (Fe/Co/Zn/Cd) transporter
MTLSHSSPLLSRSVNRFRAPHSGSYAAPGPEIETEVRSTASGVSGVIGLEKCLVRKVGFRYYVDLHVIVEGKISVSKGHGIAHKVEDAVLLYDPRVAEVLVHVEPDEADQLAKLKEV